LLEQKRKQLSIQPQLITRDVILSLRFIYKILNLKVVIKAKRSWIPKRCFALYLEDVDHEVWTRKM